MNLTAVIVWLITIVLVLNIVFQQSIVGIVTTSTVAFGVAGFALRDFIADFFAGIIISIERQIRIGDWIEVNSKDVGRVVEIGSRSTRLITNSEVAIIVPNSQLTRMVIRNFNIPDPYWRDELTITFGYEVTFDQAKRILLSAVGKIPELAVVPRKATVSVSDYTERGILWRLRFWIPDYGKRNALHTQLHKQILRNIHYAGLSVPYPRQILSRRDKSDRADNLGKDVYAILRKNPLFLSLTEEELRALSVQSEKRIYVAGHTLIHQGDHKDFSFFVVHSGLLDVYVNEQKVATLTAGDFFGEMSLLTGAPRSATVTAAVDTFVTKISKDMVNQLLQCRPEIACTMGEVLAERQLVNQKMTEAATQQDHYEQEKRGLTERIAKQIRCFFFGNDY